MFNTPRERTMLFLFIFVCLSVGVIAGGFTQSSVHTWFLTIHKPTWTPPAWVFSFVWTILYIMMAFALWLVWKRTLRGKWGSTPYLLFGLQLLLNLIWSALFFGLQSPFLALIDIILLWIILLATVVMFSNIYWVAGLLLVPYLAWVTFAAILNLVIWWQNLI